MPNRATLVPEQPTDVTVYLVLDDFGKYGRAWRESDENDADERTVIEHLITGQYEKPVRIVAFNTAEGWARDVTEDIAKALVDEARKSRRQLSAPARAFYEWHIGKDVPADVA